MLWTDLSGSNSEADAGLITNSPADRKARGVGSLAFERDPDAGKEPEITVRMAGDAATLVFIDSDGVYATAWIAVCDA